MTTIFTQRKLEWICAVLLAMVGTLMYWFPQSFDFTRLSAFSEHRLFWTYTCMIVGYVRIFALIVNGNWKGGTPILRLIGSMLGAGIFGAFVGNIIQSTASVGLSWSVGTYFTLMVGELISSYCAATDMAKYTKYGS